MYKIHKEIEVRNKRWPPKPNRFEKESEISVESGIAKYVLGMKNLVDQIQLKRELVK